MERTQRLKDQIIEMLMTHREAVLMTDQKKFCAPCGGMKISKVYKDPTCGQIGRLLESLAAERSVRR